MKTLRYLGESHYRVIRKEDFEQGTIFDQEEATWSRNGTASVSDDAATFLLQAEPDDFELVEDETEDQSATVLNSDESLSEDSEE